MSESCTLYEGDCLEVMKGLPDASVGMVLCDLPYNTTQNKWDCPIPLEPLWVQIKRLVKSGAAIALHAQTPFSATLLLSNSRWFRHEWVWIKEQGTGYLNATRAPLKTHESVLVFCSQAPPYHPQRTEGEPYRRPQAKRMSTNYGKHTDALRVYAGGRCPTTDLHFRRDHPRIHPTQKPIALLAYLIRTYSNPGDTVLDCCFGSGSTGVAALQEGRRFVGIERDPDYFRVGQQRIAAMQPTLFAGAEIEQVAI